MMALVTWLARRRRVAGIRRLVGVLMLAAIGRLLVVFILLLASVRGPLGVASIRGRRLLVRRLLVCR